MITGLGGIFYKSKDLVATRAWYKKYLGIEMESWGIQFSLENTMVKGQDSYQVFSPTSEKTTYFEPSEQSFMLNFRVTNWESFIEDLKGKGVEILDTEVSDFGKFAWIMGPDDVKIELWEQ